MSYHDAEILSKQSYDKTENGEKEIRHIFNELLPYQRKIIENPDKYGVDSIIAHSFDGFIQDEDGYYIATGNYDDNGLLEIERKSDNKWWDNSMWPEISILKRKVFIWDRELKEYTSEVLPTADRTLFVKFTNDYKKVFAIDIKDVYKHGKRSDRSDGSRGYSYIGISQFSKYLMHDVEEIVQRIIKGYK